MLTQVIYMVKEIDNTYLAIYGLMVYQHELPVINKCQICISKHFTIINFNLLWLWCNSNAVRLWFINFALFCTMFTTIIKQSMQEGTLSWLNVNMSMLTHHCSKILPISWFICYLSEQFWMNGWDLLSSGYEQRLV